MSIKEQTDEIKNYAHADSDNAREDALLCANGMILYWQSIYDELLRS